MESTASHPRLSRQRLASRPRCKSARSRCRLTQNHKRSLHRNQQYSITALTDASGAIVERYAYTAYGTPSIIDASGATRITTAVGNRYTYTGREWDETLALYHYRARMYDCVAGRFISRDPIGFEGSKWNIYEYVDGKPLSENDPTGLGILGSYCGEVFVWHLSGKDCCGGKVYSTTNYKCKDGRIVPLNYNPPPPPIRCCEEGSVSCWRFPVSNAFAFHCHSSCKGIESGEYIMTSDQWMWDISNCCDFQKKFATGRKYQNMA